MALPPAAGRSTASSVVVTSALGSLVQSTLTLLNLREMGPYTTWDDWRMTIARDLFSFGPFYALLVGAATFGWLHRLATADAAGPGDTAGRGVYSRCGLTRLAVQFSSSPALQARFG